MFGDLALRTAELPLEKVQTIPKQSIEILPNVDVDVPDTPSMKGKKPRHLPSRVTQHVC